MGQAATRPRAGRFVDLFDPISEVEYEALKRDIELHGVLVPIEIDEKGEIIDGHQRAQIASELDIVCPTIEKRFHSDADKRAHAIALNILRRQLSKPKRQQWLWEYEQLVLPVEDRRTEPKRPEIVKPRKPDTTANERQRRHRLRELIRPNQAPSPYADPWEIAAEILHALHRIRQLRDHSAIALEIDQVEEWVKELAWGPED